MSSSDPCSPESILLVDSHNLGEDDADDVSAEDLTTTPDLSPAITTRLYISHFLSTWNSRVFEFGAVLYLASVFPQTLLPMSAYALARGASAIVFSPAVGRYIDGGHRLRVVRLSIGKSHRSSVRQVPGANQPIWHCSPPTTCGSSVLRRVLVSSNRVAAYARR